MKKYCGQIMTISIVRGCSYSMIEDDYRYAWTDEMIEGLEERNGKTYPYKIGDRVVLKSNNKCATITDLRYNSQGNLSYFIKIDNDRDINISYPTDLLLPYDNMIEGEFTMEETKTKFKVGDRVITDTNMKGKIIEVVEEGWYRIEFEPYNSIPQPNSVVPEESISLVEDENKPKFKVGDKITNGKVTLTILALSSDRYVVYIVDDTSGKYGTLDFNTQDNWKLMENELQSKFYIGDVVYSTTWQRDVVIQEILPNCFYMVCDLQGLGCFKTHEDALCKDIVKPTWLEATVEYTLPNGYIFKDENGNVISTTKIVMEKKGKEYPKTYEECCKIMQVARPNIWFDYDDVSSISEEGDEYECHIENTLCAFRKLIICCNAYWKIAGDEMGLGKPWEPDWEDNTQKFSIRVVENALSNITQTSVSYVLSFPTEEMRDAFKNNFESDIKLCKELL